MDRTERLKVILENAADGIVTINAGGLIETFNPAAEKIFGYSEQEVIGGHINMLFSELSFENHQESFERLKIGGSGVVGNVNEFLGVREGGEVFPVELSASKALSGDKQIFTAIVRDVTARKLVEEDLKKAKEDLEAKVKERTADLIEVNEKLLEELDERKKVEKELRETQVRLLHSEKLASIGQLAAGVAHEINNPIGFVCSNFAVLEGYLAVYLKKLGLLEGLLASLDQGDMNKSISIVEEITKSDEDMNYIFVKEDTSKLMQETKEGLARVTKIVHDLRMLSYEGKDEKESADIAGILATVIVLTRNKIKDTIEIKKDFQPALFVSCDVPRIKQVFINLIINASQAIADKGRIVIKVYKRDENVCVEINDNGMGIAQERLKKIFDPFFTTQAVGSGVGMGLSTSYEVIKAHGGDITVDSEINKGTTFAVLLPMANKEKI